MNFRLLIPFVPALAVAQTGPTASISIDAKLAALNGASKSAQSADDNAWMLVSLALVLMSGWAGWGQSGKGASETRWHGDPSYPYSTGCCGTSSNVSPSTASSEGAPALRVLKALREAQKHRNALADQQENRRT